MRVKLPGEYQMRAAKRAAVELMVEERTRERMRAYDSFATELVILASIVTLIEDFGWGSGEHSTRVRRFINLVSERIGREGERYGDDCALTALRHRVAAYGIEYVEDDEG